VLADDLSKARHSLELGHWNIWVSEDGKSSEYDHPPFL
jgi:hypothetical protein